jgi:hypothetical protein
MVVVCSSETLIPTKSFHSQECHNGKLASNLFISYSHALYIRTPLDYNVKALYKTKTVPLLCLKINSTFHRETLADHIKLLMIQQLPRQPHTLTHNSTFQTATLAHNIKLLMIQQLPRQPHTFTHNSTFHTATLAHNIKLLMIQQLPRQPHTLTHNSTFHTTTRAHSIKLLMI